MIITSELIRAARALLRWEQKDLAEASGVSLPSVKRLETQPGALAAQDRTVAALRAALEGAGVEFTNGDQPGVKMKIYADPAQPATLTYSGHSVSCFTLGEAVIAWAHLSPSEQSGAIIKTADGRKFGRNEIDRLYRPPK